MVFRWIVSFILIYDVHRNVESRGVSRLFSIAARRRPALARARARARLLHSPILREHFDSREIPFDPFLKIPMPRALQKRCLII